MLCDIGETVLERRGGGMTENIAIYCLKAASELNTEMCEECPLYGQTGADHCCEDALQVAIKALEELQQYRTIGTVEECRKSLEICKAMVERNITPDDMENYMKFEDECIKQGFTLDSILKSREKQTAKKIEIFNGQASCPNCKHFFGEMNVIRSLIAWNMPYCKHCGQKLDWSDEE